MKYHEEFQIPIPADQDGMLGRQCPRCSKKYAIEFERFFERGYMNLRCPYCELISEIHNFHTQEQAVYIATVGREQGRRVMEEIIESTLGTLPKKSTGNVRFDHNFDDVDLGTEATESPHLSIETKETICSDCGFRYALEEGQSGVCPICR